MTYQVYWGIELFALRRKMQVSGPAFGGMNVRLAPPEAGFQVPWGR